VKSAGLGLLKENFSVYLVEDAIKGINIEKAQNDLKIMLDKGATLIKTEEVIRLLS
jgi:isochorismate hydrolase